MIEMHADVRGYFRERLVAALERQKLETAEPTEFYLVNLLAEFATTPDDESLGRPLAQMLADAVEATGWERFKRLRELGDAALYVCGFFGDSLEARGVSRSYVITIGGRAYVAACGAVVGAPRAVELGPVFEDLAARFDAFARVLDEVRESTAMRTPQDIVRLYERWRRTRSPLLAQRLEQEGVYPVDVPRGGRVVH